ncbi:hypothetical protein [Mycobacteroides abscessus]|uniref:hypothetical protein n=1 Tax=Mycobacteroides abscessus TaxID=36809 RepID=UPI00266CEDF8|nr:hypothetical protein [Mycobacteroides abscessus]MDO3331326.1 hypothetical protein [Mycobacteroides abscessus subsp. abscessus]
MARAVREDSALALVVQRAGVSAAEIETTRGVLRKLAQVDLDDLRVPPSLNVSSDGEVEGANPETPAWQSYMAAAAFVAAAGRLEAAVQRGHCSALDAISDFVNARRQQGGDVSLASLDRMMMRRLLSSDVANSTVDATARPKLNTQSGGTTTYGRRTGHR